MGRPPTRPKRLKDGFYIEVRSKGANSGMKIRSDDENAMKLAAEFYSRNKEVVVLGEHRNDIWLNESLDSARNKKSLRARKSSKAPKVRIDKTLAMIAEKNVPAAEKKAIAKKAATKKSPAPKKAAKAVVKKKKKK